MNCLIEILLWIKQWHNEINPQFSLRMGEYYEDFINEEIRQMEKKIEDIRAWEPPKNRTETQKA